MENVDEEEEPLSEQSKLEVEDEVGKITDKWEAQKADPSETEANTEGSNPETK